MRKSCFFDLLVAVRWHVGQRWVDGGKVCFILSSPRRRGSISQPSAGRKVRRWVPAFAGMTKTGGERTDRFRAVCDSLRT
ncbi:hypothetical protein DM806_24930 [Sphingobium lactosutens]|nr:hypothetical protein [Sphingobium lactosutens]